MSRQSSDGRVLLCRNVFTRQDDDVTIHDDLKLEPDVEKPFPLLRQASWEDSQPVVQDRQLQVRVSQEPLVSWMPQLGLRREVGYMPRSDQKFQLSSN